MTMTKLDKQVLRQSMVVLRRERQYELAEKIRLFLWKSV